MLQLYFKLVIKLLNCYISLNILYIFSLLLMACLMLMINVLIIF